MKNSSRGILILTMTNVLSKILSLVYIPILILNIGNEGWGNYNSAYLVYTFIYMVTIAGSSSAIPKLIAEYSASGHERDAMASFKVGRAFLLGMGVIMTLILIVISGFVVDYTGLENSRIAILALAPAILITAISSAYRGYFQGRHNLVPLGISQFIEQVLNVICSLFFSWWLMKYSLSLGVAGGAIGTAIGALASVVYLKIKYKKDLKERGRIKSQPRKHNNKYIFNYIWKYSVPLLVSALILYGGNNLIDQGIITNKLAELGYSQVQYSSMFGDFGKYFQLINLPMIIISSLALSVFPIIARENASKDKKKLNEGIAKIFKIGFMIGLPSAITLSVLSKPIFHFIYFKVGHMGGAELMVFGGYVFIFSSIYQLSVTLLNSLGRVRVGAMTAFITIAVRLLADFIFIGIATINIYGAVIGLLLSNYVGMMINIKIIENHTRTKESYLNSIVKPAIASIVMGIVLFIVYFIMNRVVGEVFGLASSGGVGGYITNAIALVIAGYVGSIVYLKVMIKTKGMENEDLSIFPRKLKKLFFI